MIKKLKSKIFLLIMVSLSILVVGMIVIFGTLNYTNTLRTANILMNRVSDFEFRKPRYEENFNDTLNIEGLYFIEVKDSKIISDNTNDSELEEYALKISQKNSESGVIGKYLYKVMRTPQGASRIVFMENEKTITQLKMIIVYAIVGIIFSIAIIYWIARKLTELIVKPVEETFEKQRQFISDASHELKTPLAVIEANADVLENELGENKWLRIYTK